jgi:hypothetical protein
MLGENLRNKFDIIICKPTATLVKGAVDLGQTGKGPRWKLSLFNNKGFQLHCTDRTNTNVEFVNLFRSHG